MDDKEKLIAIKDCCIENMKSMRGQHSGKVHTMDHPAYATMKYIYGLIDGEDIAEAVEALIDTAKSGKL